MYWIYDMPSWFLALLTVGGFLVVSVGGLQLSRHYITNRLLFSREINEGRQLLRLRHGHAVFRDTGPHRRGRAVQNYSLVSSLVSQEASTIGVLYRDVGGYPEPLRTELRRTLREYANFTIEKTWPAQQRGIILDQPRSC